MSNELPPSDAPPIPTPTDSVGTVRSIVHSHWRPIGGWICIVGIGYELLLVPIIQTILNLILVAKIDVVHVDKVLLLELVGMFVVYRSFDKYHEVDTK